MRDEFLGERQMTPETVLSLRFRAMELVWSMDNNSTSAELRHFLPLFSVLFFQRVPDVYLEVQHPCWSCNSNSSSANASAG
ncbi:hypothetical protein, partial [Bifidobacterium longum]|uniref:hypothetical protein n=1 Tax=Bifidobacterium longum TaxID=216816 RepID=UPI001E33BF40